MRCTGLQSANIADGKGRDQTEELVAAGMKDLKDSAETRLDRRLSHHAGFTHLRLSNRQAFPSLRNCCQLASRQEGFCSEEKLFRMQAEMVFTEG